CEDQISPVTTILHRLSDHQYPGTYVHPANYSQYIEMVFQSYLWTKPSTTPIRDIQESTFIVIHPFHPLYNREFQLVNYTFCWGESRVYFYSDDDHLCSMPAIWTNVGPKDVFVELSAGRSPFRVEDLLNLTALLVGIAPKV
ncbi:MAG: hypothetical protein GQ542_06235, partial [Desulforhopalus sp.]|nr:hypothetical protein [Desulforhopalus sp.]